MAVDTFQELWRRLKLYCPSLPVPLCQKFINDAYRRILDYCDDAWSFQYGHGQFICNQSIYGTATATRLSNSVTVTALSQGSIPGDNTTIVGRQVLFSGQAPIYSVTSNPDATTFTMDQPYGLATGSVSFEITNVYFTPEYTRSDFERLVAIVDPPNNWQLPFDIHFEELDNMDPQRSSTGSPWLLADVGWNYQYLSSLGVDSSGNLIVDSFGNTKNSSGLPRKEFWPRMTSAYVFPYIYKRRISDMTNPTDKPLGFIRGDVIFEAALASASLWPGTATVRNPMLNPINASTHERRFQTMLHQMRVIDASVIERELTWVASYTRLRYPPMYYSARFLQQHIGVPMESWP